MELKYIAFKGLTFILHLFAARKKFFFRKYLSLIRTHVQVELYEYESDVV